MEVTKDNFNDELPAILKSIEKAAFVSIDGEFTGLSNENIKNSALDTQAERYLKNRDTASKFLLVQFGLCAFHYDEKNGKFSSEAFNFYVFPRPFHRNLAPDSRFMCQTSSIDFLINQNFDFNKLFKSGISYLRLSEVNKIKENISERQQIRKNQTPNAGVSDQVPPDQREFISDIEKKFATWLKDSKNTEKLTIDNCNAYQRRLIYNCVKPKFIEDFNFHLETVKGKNEMIVTKMDESEQKKLEQDRDQQDFDELQDAIGFTKVVQKIIDSKKIVVGHNMFLDLLYTMHQFVTPLPENYDEFKIQVRENFPKILDTKLMASTSPLKEEIPHSSLEELVKILSVAPFKMAKMASGNYKIGDENGKYHEAGYDAFITGLCFIAMSNKLANYSEKNPKENVWPNDKYLSPFFNKVNMMRIMDISYLNLAEKEEIPDRSHVFHVTFPVDWKIPDLLNLFSPFGSVSVSWINENSAYVSLREHVANVKSVVMSTLNCSSIYKIVPYDVHKKMEMIVNNSKLSDENQTGITPMLENSSPFKIEAIQKKRSAETEPETFKRSKSISDPKEEKLFESIDWDQEK